MDRRTHVHRLSALALAGAVAATIPARAAEGSFSDVSPEAWYAPAVAYCVENNLMNGTGDGMFTPDGTMTRGMLAAVIYRLAGSPPNDGNSGFPDVPSWCTSALTWARETGIMEGYDDGRSGAEDPVTREQFVTLLWRYAGKPKTVTGEDFADEDQISPYAAGAVDWSRARGIIRGREGNLFAPSDGASRAESAQILMNYRSRSVDSEGVSVNTRWAPSGLAVDQNSVLVTDTGNKVIWKLGTGDNALFAGKEGVLDLSGEPLGGYHDASLVESYFKEPWAIAPFQGGWAVSDAENHAVRLIREDKVQTLSGKTKENLDVTNLGVVFQRPTGLAADEEGNLYVADTGAGAVRKVSAKGQVTTAADKLQEPTGLCWKNGALYIVETGANRIAKLENGTISTVAGSGEEGLTDGPAAEATFNNPQGVAVGDDGTVYVADTVNGAIRRVKDGVVETLNQRDWAALEIFPVSPRGILVWEDHLYVCDNFSRKLLILPLEGK